MNIPYCQHDKAILGTKCDQYDSLRYYWHQKIIKKQKSFNYLIEQPLRSDLNILKQENPY